MAEDAKAERKKAGCADVDPSAEGRCREERQEQDGCRAQGKAVREVKGIGGISEEVSGGHAGRAEKRACCDDQRGGHACGEEAGQGERIECDEKGEAESQESGAQDRIGPGPAALPEAGEGDAKEEFKDQWVCPEGEWRKVKAYRQPECGEGGQQSRSRQQGPGEREAEGHKRIEKDLIIQGPAEGQNRRDASVGAGVGNERVGADDLRRVERRILDGTGHQQQRHDHERCEEIVKRGNAQQTPPEKGPRAADIALR